MPDKCPKCGAEVDPALNGWPHTDGLICLTRQLAQRGERIRRLEEMLTESVGAIVDMPCEYHHAIDDLEDALDCNAREAADLLFAARKYKGVVQGITDWPSAALSPSGEAGAEAGK